MPSRLSERIAALERRRPSAKGGVVHVLRTESIEEALARAGPGQYLVVPQPGETVEEWEKLVRQEEQGMPSFWATKLAAYERSMGEGADERARSAKIRRFDASC